MIKLFKYKIGRLQLLLTMLVWVLIFVIPLLFGDFAYGIDWNHVFKIWKEYSILFVIFLANRFILMPYLFFKEKRRLYFLSIISIVILFSIILFFVDNNIESTRSNVFSPPPHGSEAPGFNHPELPPGPREFIPPYANLFIISVLMIGFDSGLLFFSMWMQSEQNNLKVEKESIKNKMAFLQNQISPHFFMNTLNNIHALVDIDTEEAKEAIIKLSKMMDYMLYESQTPNISLKQELDFIKSYVDLMKLRFTDDVKIILELPSVLPMVKIPPLLTISFIENAFKYGVSYESASYINIHIETSKTLFSFKVSNSVHPGKEKKKNSGIGIQNARNRLELIYKKNYELLINNKSDNTFEVNLNIPL